MASLLGSKESRSAARAALVLAALLAGCGDGGSGGSGGTGGSGGSGGAGAGGAGGAGGQGGATTTTIAACPIGSELHVTSTIVGPDGAAVGDEGVNVAGTVTGAGVDTPPTFECGSGMAWAQIADAVSGDTWIGCFQAPGLVWNVGAGQEAQLRRVAVTHPIAPATLHTTLLVDNALAVHVEAATVETEVALPAGITLARGDQVCSSPESFCLTKGYEAEATSGGETVTLSPGEAAKVGAHRLYLDRYWIENISSACDGGGAYIVLSVTPDSGQ